MSEGERESGGGGGIASRCAISGPDSMAERSQLSDIDSSSGSGGRGGGGGGRGEEEKQSILEFRGIGRERRCEGHQSGEEREREERERAIRRPVGRSVGRGPKGVTASRMDQLESREKERKREQRKEKSCRRFPF